MIGNKQVLKDTLSSSGVYDNFVSSVISANQKQSAGQPTSLPLDDPQIEKIANNAFNADILKGQTDKFLDDTFLWLEGESDQWIFNLDFTEARDDLFVGLSEYAANRLAFLPECGFSDTITPNVFEISCRPVGVSLEETQKQVLLDFQNGNFLESAQITEQNLPRTADGQNLQEKFNIVPLVYKFLSNSILVFGLFLALSIALFIYARLPKRKAFKALGRDLLTSGLMLLGFTVVFGFVIPRYTETFSIQGNETSELFNQVLNLYIKNLDILIVNITLQVATVGAAILIIERMSRPSDIYKPLIEKSGLITSHAEKASKSKAKHSTKPPVQTSEQKPRKKRKSKKRKTNKYRKINL